MAHPLSDTLLSFEPAAGRRGRFYSLPRLKISSAGEVSRLPVSIRVQLESVLRNCHGERITEEQVRRLAAWESRATALRRVDDDADFRQAEFNRAFVLMQYVGYLRRSPDDAPDTNLDGLNFWLSKLNQFNGNFIQAEMVKAFLVALEYRGRFGQP